MPTTMALKGFAQTTIAREIEIGPTTLLKYYRQEFVYQQKALSEKWHRIAASIRVRTPERDP
jgi:hypothetical protein